MKNNNLSIKDFPVAHSLIKKYGPKSYSELEYVRKMINSKQSEVAAWLDIDRTTLSNEHLKDTALRLPARYAAYCFLCNCFSIEPKAYKVFLKKVKA